MATEQAALAVVVARGNILIHALSLREIAWMDSVRERFGAVLRRAGIMVITRGEESVTLAEGFTRYIPVPIDDVDLAELERLLAHGPIPPRLVLGPRSGRPSIDGRAKDRLTRTQYDVVEVLVAAGARGLSLDEFTMRTRHGDWRGILRRLRQDPDWAAVIRMAGRPGGRYYALT
jgi:hypothetical protein